MLSVAKQVGGLRGRGFNSFIRAVGVAGAQSNPPTWHEPAHRRCSRCNVVHFCDRKCVKKGWPAHRGFCERHQGICKRLENLVSVLSPALPESAESVFSGNTGAVFIDAVKTFVTDVMSRVEWEQGVFEGFAETIQGLYVTAGVKAVVMMKAFVPVMEEEGFISSTLASSMMEKLPDYPPLPASQSDEDKIFSKMTDGLEATEVLKEIDMAIECYLKKRKPESLRDARLRSKDEEQPGGTPDETPPSRFLCPISWDVMESPVKCADGVTYEARCIQEWLERSSVSPMTGEQLTSLDLQPDEGTAAAIETWRAEVAIVSRFRSS